MPENPDRSSDDSARGWANPSGASAPPPASPEPPAAAPPPMGGWGGAPVGGAPAPGWGPPPGWGPQQPPGGWSQPGWTGGPVVENKPGVIPLRPLAIGELLDGSFSIMRRYPGPTLGLSAIVITVTQVLQAFATNGFLNSLEDSTTNGDFVDFPTAGLTGFLAGLLLSSLATLILTGVLTVVAGDAVLGRPVSTAAVWARVRPRLWGLLGLAVLSTLVIGVGFVFCIVPGVFLYVALSLATPALVLERQGVVASMKRSRALVRGSWWRCAGVLLLAGLISGAVGGAISFPFTLAGGGLSVFAGADGSLGLGGLAITTVGAIIAGTITTPFTAGIRALLYVDRRMRAEGLDVELAAAAAAPSA